MQPARECGPPCLQGRSVCDSTNSGWGGRQSFQKALNQLDYPVTLLFTCSLGFLHPRRGNETVGGRVPETGEGSQGSIASCGSTGVPHFFLHVMWVITFLLLLDNLTPPTSTHHAQLTSYRWNPKPIPPSSVSFLRHNPTYVISYSTSLPEVPESSQVQGPRQVSPATHLSSFSISPFTGKSTLFPQYPKPEDNLLPSSSLCLAMLLIPFVLTWHQFQCILLPNTLKNLG